MSPSKHQLTASMRTRCLSLDEKTEILDYAAKNLDLGCQKLSEHLSVGKTAIGNILKCGKTLRKDLRFFKGTHKKCSHGKYHILNEILYNCNGKCAIQIFILMGLFCKMEQWRLKKD